MRAKAGALTLLVLASVLLAQEGPREAAVDAVLATGVELAALLGRGVDAVDNEARATLTPALVAWLETLRDEATARGVEALPVEIRDAFEGYLPAEVLEHVRWRIEPDSVLTGQNFFQADVRAVTLDNVILFADAEEAANIKLWAHELYHVLQYRQWGIDGFVERYLADRSGVERHAWEFRWQWMKATGRTPPP